MKAFEQKMRRSNKQIRRTNRLCAAITIAGIFPSIWLGMLIFKGGLALDKSIVLSEVLVYAFIFLANMLTRKDDRGWQALKFSISAAGAAACAMVPYIGTVFAIPVMVLVNALVCRIGYAVSPPLRYADKIHRLTAWSGGKNPGTVEKEINKLAADRVKMLLAWYKKQLGRADKLAAAGGAGMRKAQGIYLGIIAGMKDTSSLSGEECLGKAYLGLGKTQQALGEIQQAAGSFAKARAMGVWDKALDSTLALSFASSGARTPEAFDAYIAYLAQSRGKEPDEARKKVAGILESMCSFTEAELAGLAGVLSREIAARGMREDELKTEKPARVAEIEKLNEKVKEAVANDPAVFWAYFNYGLARLFSGKPREALAALAEAAALEKAKLWASVPRLTDYYLGLAHAALDESEKAAAAFANALQQNATHSDSLFHAGRVTLIGLPGGRELARTPLEGADKERLGKAVSLLTKAGDLCGERADYLFFAALALYKAGDNGLAERRLEMATGIDPNWGRCCYLEGIVHVAMDDFNKARQDLNRAVKLSPSYQPAFSLLGTVCFELDDWQGTEESCRQALKLDSKDTRARSLLGRALFRLEKYAEAATALRGLVDPREPDVLYCYGRSLMKTDRFELALPVLERLAGAGDTRAPYLLGCAHANLGNASGDSGELRAALEWFDRAAQGTPPPEVYLERGKVNLKLGRLAEARADLERAGTNTPDLPYYMAIYHHLSGDDAQAGAELEKAQAASPAGSHVYIGLGVIKESQGDYAAAAQMYRTAAEKGGSQADAKLRLGIVYCKQGEAARALAELDAARKAGCPEEALGYYLGWAHLKAGSYDSAIAEWSALHRKRSRDTELAGALAAAYQMRARELFSNSEYAASVPYWEACLRAGDGNTSPITQFLAEALFRQGASALKGDSSQAKEHLLKAAGYNGRMPQYLYYVALAELAGGDFRGAAERLEGLLEGEAGNHDYAYALAWGMAKGGEPERAIPLLAAIIESAGETDAAGARLLLAECYRATGDSERATGLVKAALGVEV